jgi:hypothetical protein
MSIEAMNWARKILTGCPGRKAVLMSLADRADEQWSCFPSLALIAAETELCERSVRRHLRELEDQGVVYTENRPGRRSRYTIGAGITPDMKSSQTPDTESGHPGHRVRPDNVSARTKTTGTPDKNDIPPAPPIRINPHLEPSVPVGSGEEAIWKASTKAMRQRSSRAELGKALKVAVRDTPAEKMLAALKRYVAEDPDVLADRGQPAIHRWVQARRYEPWLEDDPTDAPGAGKPDDWWEKAFQCGSWSQNWPPKSQAPAHIRAKYEKPDLFQGSAA